MAGSDGDLKNIVPNEVMSGQHRVKLAMERNALDIQRHSMDIGPVNKRGKQLLEFCNTCGLIILNGRVGRDKGIGKFTRIDTTGNSVVDYLICRPESARLVSYFNVHQRFPESDHLPVVFSLRHRENGTCNDGPVHQSNNWENTFKYVWSMNDVPKINEMLNDNASDFYRKQFEDSMINMASANDVAKAYNNLITQACERVCDIRQIKLQKRKYKAPGWFDTECRMARAEALRACETANQGHMSHIDAVKTCKNYRSAKQRKQRQFRRDCLDELEHTYHNDKNNIWDVINKFSTKKPTTQLHHIQTCCFLILRSYPKQPKSIILITVTKIWLKNICNSITLGITPQNELALHIINRAFTECEIERIINRLKNNKSPGCDNIPSEFIKGCSKSILPDLCNLFNYMIERREFPEIWAEGIRSAIYKSGVKLDPTNYRGITVLPVFAKIFEMAIHDRLIFVNEAFGILDKFNGGFLKGSRTADNIFILKTLIQRQLLKGEKLFVCFVDFSKAFDRVNRHILFYKLFKSGLHGRVIETLHNLYQKTYFRLKVQGKLSPCVFDSLGVNQGGSASDVLFRRYMADIGEYLNKSFGVCIEEIIIVQLLWADDLILISDSIQGLQKQLNGLLIYCSKNLMVANEVKTKYMIFGTREDTELYFDGKRIERVNDYKYLGNIISETKTIGGDIFANNYSHLCSKARSSIYAMKCKLNKLGHLPPRIATHLFSAVVEPILTYGTEVWGVNKKGTEQID